MHLGVLGLCSELLREATPGSVETEGSECSPQDSVETGVWLRSRPVVGLCGLHLHQQENQGSGVTRNEQVSAKGCEGGRQSLSSQVQGEGVASQVLSWAWCQLYLPASRLLMLMENRRPAGSAYMCLPTEVHSVGEGHGQTARCPGLQFSRHTES